MEGPLPIPFEKESVCLVRGSPTCPGSAFVSRFLSSPPSPTEQRPFYTKISHHLFTLFNPHI